MSRKLAAMVVLALLVPTTATAPACITQVSVIDRPCPCANEWICCPSRHVCVAPDEACPPVQDGGDGRDGGDGPGTPDVSTPPNSPIVLASNQNTPRAIAVDNLNVYWVNAHASGGVYAVPK